MLSFWRAMRERSFALDALQGGRVAHEQSSDAFEPGRNDVPRDLRLEVVDFHCVCPMLAIWLPEWAAIGIMSRSYS
jgi:hypothetical protein